MKSRSILALYAAILSIAACNPKTENGQQASPPRTHYEAAMQAIDSAKQKHNISFAGATMKEVVETDDAIIGREFSDDSLFIVKKELGKGSCVGLIYLEPKGNNTAISKGVYRAYYKSAVKGFTYEVLGNDDKVVYTSFYKMIPPKPTPNIPPVSLCDVIWADFNQNVFPGMLAEANRTCQPISICVGAPGCAYAIVQVRPTSWRCWKVYAATYYVDANVRRFIGYDGPRTDVPPGDHQ